MVYPPADLNAVPDRRRREPDTEVQDFLGAVEHVAEDLDRFAVRTQSHLSAEDMALFDAWRLMLESDTLIDGTLSRIRAGNWAPGALRETIAEHAKVFDDMDDAYLRERASDVRDLGRCILTHLQKLTAAPIQYVPNTILVGDEISAMQIADVPREMLAGIVSTTGSGSSHVGILARGMGVPAAMAVADLPVGRVEGRELVVDGYRGRVYVAPGPTVRAEYQRLAEDDAALTSELQALRHLPAETTDGYLVPLYLNTGLVSEARPLGIEESAGVGLYRTELPFIVRDTFPGEAAQMSNYRQVLELFAPRPVTIRTLDIGGDKPLPYFPMHEANPFLGWRGIRITLDQPEIFLTQIRAILRASIGLDNLQILLPMISTVGEVDEALAADPSRPRGAARRGLSGPAPADRGHDRGPGCRLSMRGPGATRRLPLRRDQRPHPVSARRGSQQPPRREALRRVSSGGAASPAANPRGCTRAWPRGKRLRRDGRRSARGLPLARDGRA